jgi:predicted secreted protein
MATSGNNKKLYVSVAGVHTAIGGELSSSMDVNGATIDISSKDNAWDEFIMGNKNWTCSASFVANDSATSEQEKLWDALVAGTIVNIFYGTIISGVATGKVGTAYVTTVSESSDKDAVVTKDISFQGSGALGRTTTTTTGA